MSERIPIDQAIERCLAEIAELSDPTLPPPEPGGHAYFICIDLRGQYVALKRVQSGEVVTSLRAALEAMAEHECDIWGEGCAIAIAHHPVKEWCAPCWARRTLESTP